MDFLLLLLLPLLSCSGTTSGATVIKVREGSDAVLPCFIRPEKNIEKEYFDWRKVDQKEKYVFECNEGKHDPRSQDNQFKDRVSHFPERLQFGDASIKIRDTKWSDSGTYTCHFPHLQPEQIFYIKLVVGLILKDRSEENIPGAAPEPYVTAFNETERSVLLQCEVVGAFPKPRVEWRNGAGDVVYSKGPRVTGSEDGNKIVLRAYVFKADKYRCVVTQEEIGHQTESQIDVHMKDFTSEWIINIVFDTLIAAVLVFAVARGCFKAIRDYRSRSSQDSEAEITAAEENTTILNP